jgi:hypothetical protein
MKKKKLYLLFLLTTILFYSCTKYDDGGISLHAKSRISKTKWIEELYLDSSGLDDKFKSSDFKIIDDHIYYKIIQRYRFDKDGYKYGEIIFPIITDPVCLAKWELLELNKKIKITTLPPKFTEDTITDIRYFISYVTEYNIIKLTKDEFWFCDTKYKNDTTKLKAEN